MYMCDQLETLCILNMAMLICDSLSENPALPWKY